MCDEYVQGSNPLSPIVTIKLQKKKVPAIMSTSNVTEQCSKYLEIACLPNCANQT